MASQPHHRHRHKHDVKPGVLLRYLHPFTLIDNVGDTIYPFVKPHLEELSDDVFTLWDKIYNLFSVLTIHLSYQNLSWAWFFQIVIMLGIGKRIMKMRKTHIKDYIQQDPDYRQKAKKDNLERAADRKETSFTNETANARNTARFDADRVEEFCVRNLKPSLEWLNRIVLTLWLNFRAYVKFKFLHQLWPKVKKKLRDTPLNNLEIHDFNIGDKPFRVIKIECQQHSNDDLIMDVEIAYDGSANITITYSQESLNVSIPVTLQKFCVSNVKVRIVLKKMSDQIPFIGGIQFFFLESPIIDWQTADAAKVVDLPGLDSLLKGAIENQIIKRFVLPNKLTIPIKLEESLAERLEKLKLPVRRLEDWEVAMPQPVGVVRVTAVRAEGLRATDFGFQHYKTSKNLHPFHPTKFSCSEVLPKKNTGDPYVQISIGRATHRSAAIAKNLNPEWNFVCEFPIEYFHKAVVNIDIFDEDVGIAGMTSDDALGKITEKVNRIKDRELIEGWYNCQIYQGRAFLRFEWISLVHHKPCVIQESDVSKEKTDRRNVSSGVVCILIGTLHCSEIIRPTCFLEMQEGKELAKGTSLDAMSNCLSWTFDEGKVFRLKNLNEANSHLTIKIYDNKSWKWIGERRFKLRRLVERNLEDYYRFPNPYTNLKPVALSLRSQILYDDVGDSHLDLEKSSSNE